MNDAATTELDGQPEVRSFVERVRGHLGDLDEETRDELAGGLEADIAELVADRGPDALPDPKAYADELRLAAGLPPRARHSLLKRGGHGTGRTWSELVDGWLDSAGARWRAFVGAGWRRPAWELLVVLRPAWWIFRAWLAVELFDGWFGRGWPLTPVPSLRGPVIGALVLALAALVSVQIGRGHWWPGSRSAGGASRRLVLLGLNVFAIAVAPGILGSFPNAGAFTGMDDDGAYYFRHGVFNNGSVVCNLQPYDAQGRPLQGVQLLDERGHPLEVNCGRTGFGPATKPWLLGDVERWNVFPQARRHTGLMPELRKPTLPAVVSPLAADPTDSEKAPAR